MQVSQHAADRFQLWYRVGAGIVADVARHILEHLPPLRIAAQGLGRPGETGIGKVCQQGVDRLGPRSGGAADRVPDPHHAVGVVAAQRLRLLDVPLKESHE